MLAAVDGLCEELRETCGMTRLSIVLDRRPIPLTISYESGSHTSAPLAPTAYLELEIAGGVAPIGYVTLENSLLADYPVGTRARASAAISHYATLLQRALQLEGPFPLPSPVQAP